MRPVQPQVKDEAGDEAKQEAEEASQPGDVGDVVLVAALAVDLGAVAREDCGSRHNGKSATVASEFSQIRILQTG